MITKNQINLIKGLSLRKNRLKNQCFVVEGEKSVEELLDSNFEIISLYATSLWINERCLEDVNCITKSELLRISSLKSPDNILAIVKIPNKKKVVEGGVTLVLDNLNDPGNLGTIIRLCDWFGVKQIICSKDTVDNYNSKVIQASMGSVFRVNLLYVDLYNYLKNIRTPVYGAFMHGESLKDVKPEKDIHIIFGNESNGISDKLMPFITKRITINNIGRRAESLNVATATAIFLHEFCV